MTHLDTSRIGTGATSPNSTWNVLAEVGQDVTSGTTFLAGRVNLCEPFSLLLSLYSSLPHHLPAVFVLRHFHLLSPRAQLAYLQSLRFYRSPSSFSQTSWIVRILYFPNLACTTLLLTWGISLEWGCQSGKSMKTSVLSWKHPSFRPFHFLLTS